MFHWVLYTAPFTFTNLKSYDIFGKYMRQNLKLDSKNSGVFFHVISQAIFLCLFLLLLLRFFQLMTSTICLYFSGPNSLCRGLSNGNYVLRIFSTVYTNYYLTCSNYHAFCRPCAPTHPPLVYSSYCDKCLSAKNAGKCNHNYSPAHTQN